MEFGELPEFRSEFFPPEFRRLGRPMSVYTDRWSCSHWDDSQWRHWLAVVPGRPELVAGRVLRELSYGAIEDTRAGFSFLPALAEAEGEAGDAVWLCVAYGLGARRPQDRLAAMDAPLVLAARGQLDAERLGADPGRLAVLRTVKPLRLAEAIRTAAATGAYGTAWSVLRAALAAAAGRTGGRGRRRRRRRGEDAGAWARGPGGRGRGMRGAVRGTREAAVSRGGGGAPGHVPAGDPGPAAAHGTGGRGGRLTCAVSDGIGSADIDHIKSNKRRGTMLLPVSHKAFVITQHPSCTVTT